MMKLTSFVTAGLFVLTFAGNALAGDFDGYWKRDDGKIYYVADDMGIEAPLGEYWSRFIITDAGDGKVAWDLRFTRVDDEGGFFQTRATTRSAVKKGATKLEMDFGWVDLDEKGKVIARGTERHTVERADALPESILKGLREALACHRRIDSYLDPTGHCYDPAAALREAEKGVENPITHQKDDSIEMRRKALESRLGKKTEKAETPKPEASPAGPWETPILGIHVEAREGDWANYSVKIEQDPHSAFLLDKNSAGDMKVEVTKVEGESISLVRDNNLRPDDQLQFTMRHSSWDPATLSTKGVTPSSLLLFALAPLFKSDELQGWPGDPFVLYDFNVVPDTKKLFDKEWSCRKVSFRAKDPDGLRLCMSAMEWDVTAWLSQDVRGTFLVALEATALGSHEKGLEGGPLQADGTKVTVRYTLDGYGRAGGQEWPEPTQKN